VNTLLVHFQTGMNIQNFFEYYLLQG